MTDESPIELDTNKVICGLHGEVFRASWPSAYPYFSVVGMQRLLETEEFQKLSEGRAENINSLLEEQPLCCRLGPKGLLDLWGDIHKELETKSPTGSPWKVGLCRICKGMGLGVEYETKAKNYSHVCFRCIVYKARKFDPRDN